MEMLQPGTIKWGYKFMGYSKRENKSDDGEEHSHLDLTFRHRIQTQQPGSQEPGRTNDEEVTVRASILVGCDGIRSAVRSSKLDDEVTPLRYLDCIVILGITTSPYFELTDGKTVFQTADGTTRLYAMPFARPGEETSLVARYLDDGQNEYDERKDTKGLSMWQLSFPMEESDAKKLSKLGPSALKAEALRRCNSWHDPIPELLLKTPEELITGYPCYDRALIEKDILRNGSDIAETAGKFVTILGDAAHPMSPFKGQGANQALLDAVLLAQKICGAVQIDNKRPQKDNQLPLSDKIPLALAEFEEEMLKRCAVKVKKSADAAKFLHTDVAISEGNVTRGAAAAVDTFSTGLNVP